MDTAEEDVLAFMNYLKEHRAKIHSTNPLKDSTARSNGAPMSSASSLTKQP